MSAGGWPPRGPQQWTPTQGYRPPAYPPPQRNWAPPQQFQQQPMYAGYHGRPGSPWQQHPGFPPPRRRRGLGWFIGLLVIVGAMMVLGLALLGALAAIAGSDPTPTPPPQSTSPVDPSVSPAPDPFPEPSPPASPTPPPSPDPVPPPEPAVGLPPMDWPELPPPNSTDPDWVTLQTSHLYTGRIPALEGCPPPDYARNLAELETQATDQMACIQAAWKPILQALNLPTHDIPIYFYEGRTVETPCGAVSAPALYCSAGGGAIYFGEMTLNGTSWHEFGVKDMAGHEYGHHLQAIAGFFQAEWNIGTGNEGARRLELQATCMGYAMISQDRSFTMSEDTFNTFEPYLRSVIEDGIHGSRDSLAYWGLRGLYSTHLANCNTWTSPSEDVD